MSRTSPTTIATSPTTPQNVLNATCAVCAGSDCIALQDVHDRQRCRVQERHRAHAEEQEPEIDELDEVAYDERGDPHAENRGERLRQIVDAVDERSRRCLVDERCGAPPGRGTRTRRRALSVLRSARRPRRGWRPRLTSRPPARDRRVRGRASPRRDRHPPRRGEQRSRRSSAGGSRSRRGRCAAAVTASTHRVAPSGEPRSSTRLQPRAVTRPAFSRRTDAEDARSAEVGTRSS